MSKNAWPVHTMVQRIAAGLLSSVGKALGLATAEREVVGSIPGATPILKVLKELKIREFPLP